MLKIIHITRYLEKYIQNFEINIDILKIYNLHEYFNNNELRI